MRKLIRRPVLVIHHVMVVGIGLALMTACSRVSTRTVRRVGVFGSTLLGFALLCSCGNLPAAPEVNTGADLHNEIAQLSPLSPAELKYRLREKFHDKVLFCGPPIEVMSVDPAKRFQQFPLVRRNTEEFQAIVRHTHLAGTGPWSAEDKQTVIREHRILSAIRLDPVGQSYNFSLRVSLSEANGLTTEGPSEPSRPHLPPNAFLIEGSIDQSGVIDIVRKEPIFHTCPK